MIRPPERYAGDLVLDEARTWFRPGARILDVGAGRRPSIAVESRPDGAWYVGLDPSESELQAAPEGSYDEMVVGGVEDAQAGLVSSFDLIVSYHTFEHVSSLPRAIETCRGYLTPGGGLVAFFSAGFAMHSILNRLLPESIGRRHIGRDPESKFPAVYDRCTYSSLCGLLGSWRSARVIPVFRGAVPYLEPYPGLMRLFLAYENWATRHPNLASHYVISAVR